MYPVSVIRANPCKFLVSKLESLRLICYIVNGKGNRKWLTLEQFMLNVFNISRQLFAVVGGYFFPLKI